MTARYIQAGELADAVTVPDAADSSKELILSSPATVDYNSPGASGFGVKRAGLVIPGSVMLLVSPRCCGRSRLLDGGAYRDRCFYLSIRQTDMVTGRYLDEIPSACAGICECLHRKPSVILICSTCTDALLGTDMERICRKSEELCGTRCVPLYMNALTREGRLPPMALARVTAYSRLSPRKRRSRECGIVGYFSPLSDTCELYPLLHGAGIRRIHELPRCTDFTEYEQMSAANFNIVLDTDASAAAADMEKRLGIPYISLTRTYDAERVHRQYALLSDVIGAVLDDSRAHDRACEALTALRRRCGGMRCSIGQRTGGNPFDIAVMLTAAGIEVKEIIANMGDADLPYIRRLAALSPGTRIYPSLSPSMFGFVSSGDVDICIGTDAAYYHDEVPSLDLSADFEPFGFDGIIRLCEEMCGYA